MDNNFRPLPMKGENIATNTNPLNRKQVDRKDNTTLWTVLAILIVAALAYGAYTNYYGDMRTDDAVTTMDDTATMDNTTNR